MKLNYLVFSTITLTVAYIGKLLTANNMAWYKTLTLPAITPPSWLFGVVWPILYILTTIAALLVWNRHKHDKRFVMIMTLFALNAGLNLAWTYLFFKNHLITEALLDAIALEVTIVSLIALLWTNMRTAALLLVPYAVWTLFAIVLNYQIWQLN
ncbi:MAG: tryptophan-rich sensory protein [Candidatus Dependentiae bacterium]|nr:tryptophan-rich sensory protein [Candidatus Dependentiae bacterium]